MSENEYQKGTIFREEAPLIFSDGGRGVYVPDGPYALPDFRGNRKIEQISLPGGIAHAENFQGCTALREVCFRGIVWF